MTARDTSVLIVQSVRELGRIWTQHLERYQMRTTLVHDEASAIAALDDGTFDIIVADLMLDEGSALTIADLVAYRQPDAKVIFVSNSSFFSDGSIFQMCANACAYVPRATKPEDLAAMVEHYGAAANRDRAVRPSQARG